MCGTMRREDAECAVKLGIDALGFIFVRKSPRYIDADRAHQLICALPPFISRVGVFVDDTLDSIKSIVEIAGLTQLQLHGKESPQFCRELKNWNASLSICKAFSIGKENDIPPIAYYNESVDSILLDTYVKGQEGGTGKTFDWSCIDQIATTRPMILAGGLNPDNIEEAIRTVKPYAVDVNSGVEDEPGIKNHQLLEKLVSIVRQVEAVPHK